MVTRVWYFLSALLATLFGFGITAHAASVLDPQDGSLDVARTIYQALTGHRYAYAGALALIAGIALVRKWGGPRWPWVHTDAGGACLALGGAFGASLAASLAGGGALNWQMIAAAGGVAFTALGGYAAAKKIFVTPFLVPWASSLATKPWWLRWLRLPLSLVIFWFQHASDPAAQPASAQALPAT